MHLSFEYSFSSKALLTLSKLISFLFIDFIICFAQISTPSSNFKFVNRFNPKSASGCIASDTIHGSPAAWASNNTNLIPQILMGIQTHPYYVKLHLYHL